MILPAAYTPAVPLPERVRLVVLFGGRSAEHDVSCVSASHVLRAVDLDRYDVVPIAITRDGTWQLASAADELLRAGSPAELPERLDVDGPPTPRDTSLASVDPDTPTVVLPILHGPNGEDGTVQGLLELAGVPYVGAGVLGSAVSMDKAMAKMVLAAEGIPQTPWRSVRRSELGDPDLAAAIFDELGPVVFVKPANMGSSVGVSRVAEAAALAPALHDAFRYDDLAVVEHGVAGRELECAVLGNDDPQASVVGEILTDADFYDYQDKYHSGTSQQVVPADLPDEVAESARQLALQTYRALRVEGMGRVDMFLVEGGDGHELLVNEVNTLPGFTPISMYPMMWQASGLSYPELIDELVALALERHQRRASFATDVSTERADP